MTQPALYMIAGPNGAGKTTLAYEALPHFFSTYEFVNADEIARGLSPFNPDAQAMMAGRLMLKRMDDLIASGDNFAFETTGASHIFAEKIKQAKQAGYRMGLFYVWLPNAEMAKKRVKLRVSQGGHNVPEGTIKRRYKRGIAHLINLYLPLADDADIYNGIAPKTARNRLIAQKRDGDFYAHQPDIWYSMVETAQKGDGE